MLHVRRPNNLPTGRFDGVGADNLIIGIVPTFNQYVRQKLADQRFDARFGKYGDPGDTAQGTKDDHTVVDRLQGSSWPLQLPHTGIIIETDDEHVAMARRRFQALYMASMEQVEAAIGESDPSPLAPPVLAPAQQLGACQQFRM